MAAKVKARHADHLTIFPMTVLIFSVVEKLKEVLVCDRLLNDTMENNPNKK